MTRYPLRERLMWVNNDEYLYNLWKSTGMTQREFIKNNAYGEYIDNYIDRELGRGTGLLGGI